MPKLMRLNPAAAGLAPHPRLEELWVSPRSRPPGRGQVEVLLDQARSWALFGSAEVVGLLAAPVQLPCRPAAGRSTARLDSSFPAKLR